MKFCLSWLNGKEEKTIFLIVSISSLSSALPHESGEQQSPDDDDVESSSDGAMCSASSYTKAGINHMAFVVSVSCPYCLNSFSICAFIY